MDGTSESCTIPGVKLFSVLSSRSFLVLALLFAASGVDTGLRYLGNCLPAFFTVWIPGVPSITGDRIILPVSEWSPNQRSAPPGYLPFVSCFLPATPAVFLPLFIVGGKGDR